MQRPPARRHLPRTKQRIPPRRGMRLAAHGAAEVEGELLPSRMVAAILRAASATLRADGAAAITVTAAGPAVQEATGAVPPSVLSHAAQGSLSPCVTGTILACPVLQRLGPPATLVFWRDAPADDWPGRAPALAASVARSVAAWLDQDAIHGELLRQARTDPLTGLLTRRSFVDDLDRRLTRAQSVEGSGVLIVLDLDGLKCVNDQHGPEAGDAVLSAAATLLRCTFRPADLLARLHGDRFAVWLDGADQLTAAERADELCGTLPEAAASVLPEPAVPVTMSAGVALADASLGDLQELLRRAEAAMSVAKGTGGGTWQVDAGGLPRAAPRP